MFDKLEHVNNIHLYIDETIDVNIFFSPESLKLGKLNLWEKQGELEQTEYNILLCRTCLFESLALGKPNLHQILIKPYQMDKSKSAPAMKHLGATHFLLDTRSQKSGFSSLLKHLLVSKNLLTFHWGAILPNQFQKSFNSSREDATSKKSEPESFLA
jgi:hypothetical protein